METVFWLDKFLELLNSNNFNFKGANDSQKKIKTLNIIALVSIILGIVFSLKNKNPFYTGIAILVLSITILLKDHKSPFNGLNDPINTVLTNSYDTGIFLMKDVNNNNPESLNNVVYVNQALNINKGDIIAFSINGVISESNIISDVQYSVNNMPILRLLNPIKNNYPSYKTKIFKVSDSTPNIVVPPNANDSIQNGGTGNGPSDPYSLNVQNYPKFELPNPDRYDWNLELSSYPLKPENKSTYEYQGQPYGDLVCRTSTLNNPMGTINVTEYDAPPTMYGTCNVADPAPGGGNMDNYMTTNQEATVSQRVDDLLFHKGNAQAQFSPMPVDTLPNDQEAFAHFCYRSPTNLVNPKYASIFVNDPEKFKLVSKLARATGTENGGGGGR